MELTIKHTLLRPWRKVSRTRRCKRDEESGPSKVRIIRYNSRILEIGYLW
jgi:hypothetical protein